MQNESQDDLDRKADKISTYSSNDLPKYEYLTGKDLGYKPSVAQQARFNYSPLTKLVNMGLKDEEKKDGLLKRLKNFEDKSEEQLKTITGKNEGQLEAIKNIERD